MLYVVGYDVLVWQTSGTNVALPARCQQAAIGFKTAGGAAFVVGSDLEQFSLMN